MSQPSVEHDLTGEIKATVATAHDILTALDKANSDVHANERLYSESVKERIMRSHNVYGELLSQVRTTATELRKSAPQKFLEYAQDIGKEPDSDIAEAFEYTEKELPIDPKPVKTTSGTTFESVQTELNDIASTIQKASQDKLDKANAQVTKAEAILGKAEAALRHAKLAYKNKIPGWLAAVGLDESSSKESFMLVTAPAVFIRYVASFGHASTIDEIERLRADIEAREKEVTAARASLNSAFDAAATQKDVGDKITRTTSTLRSLSTDVAGVGPKLEVFYKVYGMVRSDLKVFSQVLRGGKSADGKITRETLEQQLKETKELYTGIVNCLREIEGGI